MKPNKKETSALAWIVSEIQPKDKQPDEFTVHEVVLEIEKTTGTRPSISAVRNRLWEKVKRGELEKRYVVQNGTQTTVYRKKP